MSTPEGRGIAGRPHQREDVVANPVVHVDRLHGVAGGGDLLGAEDRLDARHREVGHPLQDDPFVVELREPHPQLHHEAVHLGLGERVGALLLDRVLGRQHHERLFQLPGLVADGHLALLHRFEQRALHLGGSPVDLVGQQEVREHRPLPRHEGPVPLVVDEGPDQIGRQQVGRELDPGEVGPHALGNALCEQRLRDSRHPLDEQVATREEADQHPLHDVFLPDHDPAELGRQAVGKGGNGPHAPSR